MYVLLEHLAKIVQGIVQYVPMAAHAILSRVSVFANKDLEGSIVI